MSSAHVFDPSIILVLLRQPNANDTQHNTTHTNARPGPGRGGGSVVAVIRTVPTPPLPRWHFAYVCLSLHAANPLFSPATGNLLGIAPSFLGPVVHIVPYDDDAVRRELHYNLIQHHKSCGRSHDQSTSQTPKSDSAAKKIHTHVRMAHGELICRLVTAGILGTGSCSGTHRKPVPRAKCITLRNEATTGITFVYVCKQRGCVRCARRN